MNRFFMASLALAVAFTGFSCSGYDKTGPGKIEFIVGSVNIDGTFAPVGSPVSNGSVVRTGEMSECAISFHGKNVMYLGEKTQIVYRSDNLSRGTALNSGSLRFVLKDLKPPFGKKMDEFKVETTAAVVAVRGTTFFIKVEDPTNHYICDCNGAFTVSPSMGGNPRELRAMHHEGIRLIIQGDAVRMIGAGMLYHTDRDMENTAAFIGEKIDWARIEE